MAANIQVKVLWVVIPCNVAVGYQHFRGPCCLHLQVEVAVMSSKILESYCKTTWFNNPQDLDLNHNVFT